MASIGDLIDDLAANIDGYGNGQIVERATVINLLIEALEAGAERTLLEEALAQVYADGYGE